MMTLESVYNPVFMLNSMQIYCFLNFIISEVTETRQRVLWYSAFNMLMWGFWKKLHSCKRTREVSHYITSNRSLPPTQMLKKILVIYQTKSVGLVYANHSINLFFGQSKVFMMSPLKMRDKMKKGFGIWRPYAWKQHCLTTKLFMAHIHCKHHQAPHYSKLKNTIVCHKK